MILCIYNLSLHLNNYVQDFAALVALPFIYRSSILIPSTIALGSKKQGLSTKVVCYSV